MPRVALTPEQNKELNRKRYQTDKQNHAVRELRDVAVTAANAWQTNTPGGQAAVLRKRQWLNRKYELTNHNENYAHFLEDARKTAAKSASLHVLVLACQANGDTTLKMDDQHQMGWQASTARQFTLDEVIQMDKDTAATAAESLNDLLTFKTRAATRAAAVEAHMALGEPSVVPQPDATPEYAAFEAAKTAFETAATALRRARGDIAAESATLQGLSEKAINDARARAEAEVKFGEEPF
jgi:hypothetical protein